MGKYFGTDGVRGVAGADLTCELAMKIGRGAAAVLTGSTGHRPRILIGKDTRQSGDMLEAALTAGLCSVGADVESLGVLPTPAVAYLVRKYNADAGVVISASHNPMEFNGIKIFAGSGYKLPDEVENQIEAYIDNDGAGIQLMTGDDVGRVYRRDDGLQDYVDYLYQATTAFSRLSRCVLPTPLLMFSPSGLMPRKVHLAPSRGNSFCATTAEAPLAQSMQMFRPDRSPWMDSYRWST